MCGFIGQISNEKQEKGEEFFSRFKTASDAIYHRGPTDDGFYHDEYVSLGFRRLSIIDLEGGKQPISYKNDRYVMTFNGEIYNYIEIKETLMANGYEFSTSSDSEVLLASYDFYKEECLKYFRGMFSFLIWDKEENTLFGARDMFGIKPMFISTKGDTTYFASEKKSILMLTGNKEVNKEALQYYFSYRYVPEPMTMHKGIEKLLPGHFFIKKPGLDIEIKKYWDAEFSDDYYKTKEEAIEAIRNVIDDSMKYHIRSDVPVGALLSSGIDSTITTAMAKKYYDDILTFTLGFENTKNNETIIAKESAEALGVKNYDVSVTANEFMDMLPKLIWHMDDPLSDESSIALYFVTNKASEHVTVIISGEGADELFLGYKMYRQPLSLRGFKYIPKFLKRLLKRIAMKLPNIPGKNILLNGSMSVEERYTSNTQAFEYESEKKELLKHYDPNLAKENLTKEYYENVKGKDDIRKMQYVDLKMWMTGDILLKADRMSMANSLELRVPFLDKEVFKVATRINPKWNLEEKTTKLMLRKAARGIIPDFILDRPKLGFPVPMSNWLKDDLKEWAQSVIDDSKTEEYINKDYVKKIYEKHCSGERDYKKELWSVITFMLWHKVFIEEFNI